MAFQKHVSLYFWCSDKASSRPHTLPLQYISLPSILASASLQWSAWWCMFGHFSPLIQKEAQNLSLCTTIPTQISAIFFCFWCSISPYLQILSELKLHRLWRIACIIIGGLSDRVVKLSTPTSEIVVRFPARPQVGKLVVACRWSIVYSTEPWPTVCTGFLCP